MTAVETRGLQKKYGDKTAVAGLELRVEEGELFSLLGVNGAGKTTTIKMLTGLTRPDSGDAFLMGHSIISELSAVKALIGVSPQETAVAPNLTVRENLEFMAGIYGMTATKEKAESISCRLHLDEYMKSHASTLSGGWQRRLSIAMALISQPKVLFLDEPTLGLDVIARRELWKVLESLKGKVTVILTTHYMEEAEALSDRIGIMANGRLTACGTAAELKQQAGRDSFEDAFIALSERGDLL